MAYFILKNTKTGDYQLGQGPQSGYSIAGAFDVYEEAQNKLNTLKGSTAAPLTVPTQAPSTPDYGQTIKLYNREGMSMTVPKETAQSYYNQGWTSSEITPSGRQVDYSKPAPTYNQMNSQTPTIQPPAAQPIQIETSKGMFVPFQGTEQQAKDYVARGGALSYQMGQTPAVSNVQDVQKLYETLGLSTMNLGSQFTGSPSQIEALKGATGGQFNITPEALQQAQAITLPEVNLAGNNLGGGIAGGQLRTGGLANSMVIGANTSIADLMKQLTPPETEADRAQQNLLNQMSSLVGQQAQKAADQLTAEQSAGLPQLRQQFADLNNQILTKTAEYNALQVENQNKPITMNSIIGNERAILNAKAADIGLLQARALGLQGQIQTAQDTVNRAIDLKYSTIEAQLAVYQSQLNAIQPLLNKQEKQQALAQQLIIDQYQQQIADAKKEEANIQKAMLDYISAGGKDLNVMNQISSAPNATEAYKIMGQNAPSAVKTEVIGSPTTGYKLLTYDSQGNIVSTKSVTGPTGIGGGGTGITNNGINPATGKVVNFDNPDEVSKLPISDITKAIISGYGTTKDLTPTDKTKVISELYQVGYDPKKYVLDKLDNLVNELEKVPAGMRGILQGYIPASVSPDASAFESAKIVLTRQIARLYDVGMLSDQDVADYKKAMPSRTDLNINTSKAKVQGLKAAIGAIGQQSSNTGTIRVRVKSTGQTGALPANEFDANIYEKIQ